MEGKMEIPKETGIAEGAKAKGLRSKWEIERRG